MSSALNIAALARRTGVAPDTLRKWEQRYGILRPTRTGGGQRRYSEHDVDRVVWLKARLAEGYRIDRTQRRFWVDRFDATTTLEKPSPLSEIYWIKFKLPAMISRMRFLRFGHAFLSIWRANSGSFSSPSFCSISA